MFIDKEQYENDSNYRKYIKQKISADKWRIRKSRWIAQKRQEEKHRLEIAIKKNNEKALESLRNWKQQENKSPLELTLLQIENKSQP